MVPLLFAQFSHWVETQFGLYGQVECNHDSDIILSKISPILVIEI